MESSFFKNPIIQEVSKSHIEQLEKLEQDKLDELLKVYRKIRRDLRDRLDLIPSGTFTAQRMRSVIIQLDEAIRQLDTSLVRQIELAFSDFTREGVDDLIEEVNLFEEEFQGAITPIKVDEIMVAMESKNLLVNQYQASIKAYSEDLRQNIAYGLTQGAISESTTEQVIQNLSKVFIFEEWKLRRIARTEYHQIYNLAKIKGMGEIKEQYMPGLKKALFHPMDDRTGEDSKQAAIEKLVVPINEPFEYNYNRRLSDGTIRTEKRVFMTPPDRPNDRSILIPFQDEWVN